MRTGERTVTIRLAGFAGGLFAACAVALSAYAMHATLEPHQIHDRRVVQHHRARTLRREHRRERQSDVVRRRVPIARAAGERLRAQRRLARAHRARVQPLVPPVAEQRQHVVQHQSRAKLPAWHARATVHRPRERQRPHEVRSDALQRTSLAARLEHQADLPMLEIPHPAVHETRRPTRRPARVVVPLHERYAQSAQGGVARHPRARDPAADHEQVEHPLAQGEKERVPVRSRGVGGRRIVLSRAW